MSSGLRWVSVAAAALVLAGVAAPRATAARARVTVLKSVSGATPFPDACGSTLSLQKGSEAEPSIAVNPRRPSNIVIIHQQDRALAAGSLVNVLRVSTNGGRSWRRVALPGASPCYGADLPAGASDPWVSMGVDDTAYAVEDIKDPDPMLIGSTIGMSRSPDGGRSWSLAASLAPVRSGNTLGSDRPTVTADRRVRALAYSVWTRFGTPTSDLMFTRTRTAGRTWSKPRSIFRAPGSILTQDDDHGPWGAQVSVLPDDTLLTTFLVFAEPAKLMSMRSRDGGRTWSTPIQIGTASQQHPYDPDDKTLEVRDEPAPAPAIGPDGTAYIAYYSVSGAHRSPILFSRSRDRGRSWSTPRAIIKGPTQHFNPSLAALPDGTLGLTFYDFSRDKPGDEKLTTDYWFAHSEDRGASWRRMHVGGPFDSLTAAQAVNPQASGRFLGEYQGLAPLRHGFAAAFAMSRPEATAGPSDVFFARVQMSR